MTDFNKVFNHFVKVIVCAINGIDVFRIFDAMNDMRNIERAVKAVLNTDAHAQGTISYTTSPVHTTDKWVEQAKQVYYHPQEVEQRHLMVLKAVTVLE